LLAPTPCRQRGGKLFRKLPAKKRKRRASNEDGERQSAFGSNNGEGVMSTNTGNGFVLRRSRILIVDDQRDVADAEAALLETLGQQVWRAYNGVEALLMAQSVRPEIVLLDLQMSVMTGVEVARRLRELACMSGARIVAHTGSYTFGDDAAILQAGFDAILRKPARVEELVAVLRAQAQR
jgi:CheY-like chemotaxis protein